MSDAGMMVFARRLRRFLIGVLLAYGLLVLALGLLQRKLMYFPDAQPFVPVAWALPELEPLPVATADGLSLLSWYRAPYAQGKPTVVFFQGNAGHLGHRDYKIKPWLNEGYGVLLVGYRGYGGNTGAPSEQGLYRDARAAIDSVLAKGAAVGSLVFYGESLGTGVATQMATEYQAAGLVLESPFTAMTDVGAERFPWVPVRWILIDRYETLTKIASVHMPLLLLHGERDAVVPVKFGRQVFAAANPPKHAAYFPQAGHNDVYTAEAQRQVIDFMARLSTGK